LPEDTLSHFEVIMVFRGFRKFAKKRLLASQCTSVRLYTWKNSAPTKNILMKNYEYSSKKFMKNSVSLNSDKNNGYPISKDQHIFMIKSRSIFLRMRNISNKICREIQNTF